MKQRQAELDALRVRVAADGFVEQTDEEAFERMLLEKAEQLRKHHGPVLGGYAMSHPQTRDTAQTRAAMRTLGIGKIVVTPTETGWSFAGDGSLAGMLRPDDGHRAAMLRAGALGASRRSPRSPPTGNTRTRIGSASVAAPRGAAGEWAYTDAHAMTPSGMIAQTAEVRDAHRFDVGALERFMRDHVEGFGGSLEVRQFRGGQSNPTYYLTAAGREYVLRRKPPGKLLPSAHAVDREYRVITALGKTGFPVPRTFALCEDDAVIGTAFYIMDCVHGRVITDPAIPAATPRERRLIYESLIDVLARLHTVDWQALGLADFGRPGNYFARQLHRWTQQYRASETEKIESMERLIPWLPAHIPPGDETALVHGDFRLGNVIIHPTEPRVVGVLDWELSTLGHPLADLAYYCLPYRFTREWEGLADKDLAELGIPTEQECLAAYCQRAGRAAIADWEFCLAFAMFRLGAIAQGIMGRVVAGTANDPNAHERGRRARPLADSAWALVASRVR